MDKTEKYLASIDRTLKLILEELQKDEQKSNKAKLTKEEVLRRRFRGKPPDVMHK